METTSLLSPAVEERVSYILAEYEEARLRLRDARARVQAGERVFYLIEAEGITMSQIRQDLRNLGVDATALYARS